MALLLGPFVFTPWGNSLREARTERSTIKHLRAIGVALQSYQQENSIFDWRDAHRPAERSATGRSRLDDAAAACMNEAALYNRINLQLPFDNPANLAPLGTPVEAFFAAGGGSASHSRR